MRVSRLKNGDWQFGRSRANYITRSDAIAQNVVTRIKSFQNDWFLDLDAEIDWVTLLGSKNTKDQIQSEIERVTLSTPGVLRIDKLEIIENRKDRTAQINLDYTDIYNKQVTDAIYV